MRIVEKLPHEIIEEDHEIARQHFEALAKAKSKTSKGKLKLLQNSRRFLSPVDVWDLASQATISSVNQVYRLIRKINT